eukprot:2841-Heterococcus_DN1.PRE.2
MTTELAPLPEDLTEAEQAWADKLRKDGAALLKFGKRGAAHERTFKLTPDLRLVWKSRFKNPAATSVDLHRVSRLQRGHTTKQFHRHSKEHGTKASQSFSLIYDEHLSSLNLMCNNEQDSHDVAALMEKLVVMSKSRRGDTEVAFLHRQCSRSQVALERDAPFRLADKDGNGELNLKEVTDLVQRLNIKLSKHHIRKKFKEMDISGDGVLQFTEFELLMDHLRERPELESLWLELREGRLKDTIDNQISLPALTEKVYIEDTVIYSTNERKAAISGVLPAAQYQQFLADVQGEHLDIDEIHALFKKLEPNGSGDNICFRSFYTLMSEPSNEAFDPNRSTLVCQDMTHPLAHYWCASSHNTYLEGDQLTSASSVSRYISDLCKGCRCVELDCWDGDDGYPLIYHGYTLTGRIKFSDVIKAVKEFAFKTR